MNKFFIKFFPIGFSVAILFLHILGYVAELHLSNRLMLLVWLLLGCIDVIFVLKLGEITSSFYKSATIDTLTQLNSRDFFYESISDIMENLQKKHSSVSIIMIDLDNFKNINDTYGHIVGDELLKQVSNIFKQSVRSTDIVTRWGGDEFIITLPGTDSKDALVVADRIRSTINNHDFFHNNIHFKTSVSIGVTSIKNKMDINSFIHLADKALYKSKTNKNSVTFLGTCIDL